MAKASISIAKGKGSMAHNNRDFITENVDKSRTADNIIYKQESLEDAYENCFGKAVEEYNAKQKRADRRIDGSKGYMEQIRTSKNGEKLFYENVVQVGNMFDSHVGTEQGEVCKQILDDYMKDFQKRNPNLYVFNAVMHLDEQTPHLHIDYIPLATDYQKGLQVRNSLDKAFKQQGVEGKANKYENRTIAWQNVEKDHIEGIMKEHGLERAEDKGLDQEHLTVDQYKAVAERIHNEVRELPKQIESAPTMLNKERVTVKKEDLEQLEQRAKLSLVHEKATKKLVSDVKKDYQDTKQYTTNKMSMALMYQGDAEREYAKAREERAKAKELYEKYQKLYKGQEELNTNYKKLYGVYENQKQTITELRTENTSLKGQIADLRRSIEESVQSAVEPLKEQVKALSDKMRNIAMGEVTLMKTIAYVKDFFSGEVSGELLNSAYKTGNRFLKEDGFDDLMNPSRDIPKSVRNSMTMNLSYKKGDEGLGVYSPKGTCIMNVESFREAKESFPNCTIKNLDRSHDMIR